jgi:hypothetical protein
MMGGESADKVNSFTRSISTRWCRPIIWLRAEGKLSPALKVCSTAGTPRSAPAESIRDPGPLPRPRRLAGLLRRA